MQQSIQTIPLANLALAFIPALIVVGIMLRWSLQGWRALYAIARMLAQLLAIGFFLVYIFDTRHPAVVLLILGGMLLISAWISLNPLRQLSKQQYAKILLAISTGSLSTLLLITQGVLQLEPWYAPRFVIPLAGMLFANAMNAVSLAAERLESELAYQQPLTEARRRAYQAALIPQMNTMLAVGLVSLPGMMTGQILSGVSPLIAVRYQIMVMCMTFGSAGISIACYLFLYRQIPTNQRHGDIDRPQENG